MALWTSADVTALCPELVTSPVIASGTFDLFINMADRQVDSGVFNDRTLEAGAYLTAHMMLRAGYGKNGSGVGGSAIAAGAVTSISAGQVSIGFAQSGAGVGSSSASDLQTTRPGQAYARLVDLAAPGLCVMDSEIPDFLI
jgi:hypothetical protein